MANKVALDPNVTEYTLVTQTKDGHVHVDGPIEDKQRIKMMLDTAAIECGVAPYIGHTDLPKEIVFHNRQRLGDIIMFTCAIRDFKKAFPDVRINVMSTAMHIWDHNPYIDRTLIPSPENIVKIGPSKLTNSSNRLDWHFANAFRMSMEDALGVQIPQGNSWGDIWFLEEEYNAPRLIDRPYWIICVGGEKGWGCKMYPIDRWQKFVDMNPDITFVQIGAREDKYPKLIGDNIIDMVGQTQSKETGIRDLFKLFLNAEGSIGLVSFHMHLTGCFPGKPCIVVAGAREPVSFTQYHGHRYLSNDGALPCAVKACWKCAIEGCTNLVNSSGNTVVLGPTPSAEEKDGVMPKCVDMIEPEDIHRALQMYYIGGRLDKNKPSPKPVIENISKVPLVHKSYPKKVDDISHKAAKYGLSFGGGSLTSDDWKFIEATINKHKCKSILEFGAGLSTLLFTERTDIRCTTYENKEAWKEKILSLNKDCDIRMWDGKEFPKDPMKYDLAFVDGPAGGQSREQAVKIAAEECNIVIVHDANRPFERQWQDKYIVGKFDGPFKGGHRCHLWIRKSSVTPEENTLEKAPSVSTRNGKFIKIATNATGWGGQARSVTTMMKMLLRDGHNVEFIPLGNSIGSREFRQCIKDELQGLKVTMDYSTVREPCDTLMVYANDYVWEFDTPKMIEAFTNIKASRRIMTVNYRRGGIGTIPWTMNWDMYIFLNSGQEKELLSVHPGVLTRVLTPCTDLSEFFAVTPQFDRMINIVRHNSQGDTKFDKASAPLEINGVLYCRDDLQIHMMPGPSFVPASERFIKYPKNNPSIPEFLALGNLFWYSVPHGYMDMGPRVLLECMAAGIPAMADNWGGAADRITSETGWLVNKKSDYIEIVKNVTIEELRKKGSAARERAYSEFRAENWIKELTK